MRFILAFLFSLSPALAQQGGGVVQIGAVTANNCVKWVSSNKISDAGTACGGTFTLTANTTATSGFSAGQILYSDGSLVQAKSTTGTGNVVLAGSPTLTGSPVLGTPTATSIAVNGATIDSFAIAATGKTQFSDIMQIGTSTGFQNGIGVGTPALNVGSGLLVVSSSGFAGEQMNLFSSNINVASINTTGAILANSSCYRWGTGASVATPDTSIGKVSAGIISFGNGTCGNTSAEIRAATGTFSSGATAPTATGADNSTTLATTAYVGGAAGTWSPTWACTSGTITTMGTVVARYHQTGKWVDFTINGNVTTAGTCAGILSVTLPVAAQGETIFVGRENAVTGVALTGMSGATSTAVNVQTATNTNPVTNGARISISGRYEAN